MVEDISGLVNSVQPADRPAAALLDSLARLQAGDLDLDTAPRDGEWQPVFEGLRALGAELAAHRRAAAETESRLHAVMDMMIAMAGLDFSKSVAVGDGAGILDALSSAANMLNEELRASTVSKAYVNDIIESMIDPLIVTDCDGKIARANRAALKLSAYQPGELVGQPLSRLFRENEIDQRMIERILRGGSLSGMEKQFVTKSGQAIPVALSASAMGAGEESGSGMVCVIQDLTERKQAEEALRRGYAQEEIIRVQSALLAELSTPIIPIGDRVLVMPLVGTIDSRRAQQVMEALLEGVSEARAETAIIDITGVPMVDTQVANALIRAAQAVKLLGARVVLTGIRPEVAQTLVGLGVDLSSIATHSSLRNGVAAALARSAERRA